MQRPVTSLGTLAVLEPVEPARRRTLA